jgi:hypothetical protein
MDPNRPPCKVIHEESHAPLLLQIVSQGNSSTRFCGNLCRNKSQITRRESSQRKWEGREGGGEGKGIRSEEKMRKKKGRSEEREDKKRKKERE